MPDVIANWYDKLPNKPVVKKDKNFSKHHILPNSMVCCIGGTGAGKTNALVEFMNRKNDAFYHVIIFTGSTTDEPLYQMLQEKMPSIELYNDIAELPPLSEFDDDAKGHEKLIVFDDFINLPKKSMSKIQEYLTSGRKFGFTCWVMAQNYTLIPKTVVRNCQYFILFRLNDTLTLTNILRNHNVSEVDAKVVKEMYLVATSKPRDFFMIDLKGDRSTRFRHNFLNFF